ncbi:hypothetical protein P3T18_003210 [Paraburkholderia sp. GAS199]|uniref:hypothetical protein n=1 Tax=Paraburkholderia sp. GAS199 TaxID=3035126 RepID=UPI003D235BB5
MIDQTSRWRKQALVVLAVAALACASGCKRSGDTPTSAADSAMSSSGTMNGNAATGSTADTSSGAAAAQAATTASGASQ